MARLRSNVADIAEDSDPVTIPRRRLQRTRPRRCSSGTDSDESDTGKRKASANLVPKSSFVATTKKTQVRLGGLSALPSTSSLLGSGAVPEDLREKSPRKRGERRLQEKPASPRPMKTEVVPGALDEPAIGEDAESDVEESIWCKSIDASDSSSGEELLSPRKLFALPRKPKDTSQPSEVDMTRQLQALSIFEDNLEKKPPRKRQSPIKKPNTKVPLASSSDKENQEAGIKISPPRADHSKEDLPERPSTPRPASPSKLKLRSPSKKVPRVPTPPLRPSIDAFWTADAINDWNDQYSPQKPLKSPRKLRLQPNAEDISPTTSPNKSSSPAKRTKADIEARREFDAQKAHLAESFLRELDRTITQGRIASLSASTGGVHIIWSKTLNSTAGRANWRRETTKSRSPNGETTTTHIHHASIELASKVISTPHRLLNVLAHEFCHLANFMISGVKDQPHGKSFKEWGQKCTAAFGERGIEVTTKHSYEIEYKYVWRCSEEECGMEFKRHSKSIDPQRHRCGGCKGGLVQIRPVPRGGKKVEGKDVPATPGNGYAAYVKANFAGLKKSMAGASHKEVMEALGRKYRAEKAAGENKKLSVESVAIDLEVMKLDGRQSPVVIDLD